MEQQKEETKHYTPQLALKESKEHFNWREYAQIAIDKYVAEAVKDSRTKTQVEFYKPDKFDYDETREHLIKACQELGWEVTPSQRRSFGCIYLDIDWSNADKR